MLGGFLVFWQVFIDITNNTVRIAVLDEFSLRIQLAVCYINHAFFASLLFATGTSTAHCVVLYLLRK